MNIPALFIDFGFFETYDISIIAGRPFSEEYGVDRIAPGDETVPASFVISSMAARQLGADSPEDAIGLSMTVEDIDGVVVGVAEDIYFESLHSAVEPLLYAIPPHRDNNPVPMRYGSIRITGNRLDETLTYIDDTWREFEPDQPVARRFLAQDLAALYDDENRQGTILLSFSLLAVFIAGIGIFGLASFSVEQRRKEIGIRKVLGGSALDIVKTFTREFIVLVFLASLVAWPLAYFAMMRWLEAFAFRIDLTLWPFVCATAIAAAVASVTITLAALRAEIEKPIVALRYE
jgi:putative ABC transport system permease protein